MPTEYHLDWCPPPERMRARGGANPTCPAVRVAASDAPPSVRSSVPRTARLARPGARASRATVGAQFVRWLPASRARGHANARGRSRPARQPPPGAAGAADAAQRGAARPSGPDQLSRRTRRAGRPDARGNGAARGIRRSRPSVVAGRDSRPSPRVRDGDRVPRDADHRLGRAAVCAGAGPDRSRRRVRSAACLPARSRKSATPLPHAGNAAPRLPGRFPMASATSGARRRRCY